MTSGSGSGSTTRTPKSYVAKVGDNYYESLSNAIANAGDTATIELLADITLAQKALPSVANKTLTIEGNGKTIKFPADGVFGHNDQKFSNGTLTINDVKFENTSGSQQGYAVVTELNGTNMNVTFNGCTFTNMWDAIYCNNVTEATTLWNSQ